MQYQVFRNKNSSDADFELVNQIYKRIMSEDKYLCEYARKNINAGVFVNGVHLKRGEDGRRQFGRIDTGDQVVVWKEAGKALKFSCEFLQGEGKDGRPAGMPRFKIEFEGSGGRAKGKEREL